MGALAAGSAAAVGSGAFNIVSAEREVSVNVAGDADAYLGLEALDEEYAGEEEGLFYVDIGENKKGGKGVNERATTIFKDVFEITNQGTENVQVTLATSDSENPMDGSGLTQDDLNNPVFSFDREEQGGSSFWVGEGRFDENEAYLEPGQSVVVHITVDFIGNETGVDEPDNPEDLEAIVLYAEQSGSANDPTYEE